jgi:hypothetical protein
MRVYDVLEKVKSPETVSEVFIIRNDTVYTFKDVSSIWVLFLFLEVKAFAEKFITDEFNSYEVHQLRIEVF